MKVILVFQIFLMMACSTVKDTVLVPPHRIISGFIGANNSSGTCEINFGRGTEKLSCNIFRKEDEKYYVVEIQGNGVFKQPPNCVFEGSMHTKKDKVSGKIETNVTLMSASKIWIELPTYKSTKPQDAIAQFICID